MEKKKRIVFEKSQNCSPEEASFRHLCHIAALGVKHVVFSSFTHVYFLSCGHALTLIKAMLNIEVLKVNSCGMLSSC